MTGAVRLLSGADAPDLRRLLTADPVSYAMVAERIQLLGVGASLGAQVWGWFVDEQLTSALYMGANVVPIHADESALAAFSARAAISPRRCSSIVGPAAAVRRFFDGVGRAWGRPREIRAHQPLLAITGPPAVAADPRVRPADIDDIDTLFPASVAMFTEELGVSPLAPDGGAAYRRRVANLIRQGRTFVLIDDGNVLFKAEVGVVANGVAQIQGVWVDPSHRGQHLSEPAMAAVVAATQQQFAPTVSLYVNDFNHAALAAYRRVGFEQIGEFATILY